jgi:hypothetical protein
LHQPVSSKTQFEDWNVTNIFLGPKTTIRPAVKTQEKKEKSAKKIAREHLSFLAVYKREEHTRATPPPLVEAAKHLSLCLPLYTASFPVLCTPKGIGYRTQKVDMKVPSPSKGM